MAGLAAAGCSKPTGEALNAEVQSMTVEDMKRESPELAGVFDADPELAESYLAALKSSFDEAKGMPDAAGVDAARSVLERAMVERLVTAPEPVLRDFPNVAAQMFAEIEAKRPALCRSMLSGQPVGDMSSVLGKRYAAVEAKAMADVLSATPVDGASGDAARGQQLAVELVSDIADKMDWDAATALGGTDTADDPRFCELLRRLSERRTTLPVQDMRDLAALDAAAQ